MKSQAAGFVSFDFRNILPPFAMLRAANHFAQMGPGDQMEIIGDTEDIYEDLKIILPDPDYELISEVFDKPGKGEFTVKLRKK